MDESDLLTDDVSEPVTRWAEYPPHLYRRRSSSVFAEGADERELITAPPGRPVVLIKKDVDPSITQPTHRDIFAAYAAALKASIDVGLHFIEFDRISHAKSERPVWREEYDKWVDVNCKPTHREAAKAAIRSIANCSFVQPEITLSPDGGIAVSWFSDEAGLTLVVEVDACVLVETHSRYTVQMNFDSAEDAEFSAEAGRRVAEFCSEYMVS